MTRALGVVLAGVIMLTTGGVAGAAQCPAAIERGKAALYDYKKNAPAGPAKDAKVADIEERIRAARELQTAGQDESCLREATDILKQLGK